MSEKNCTSCKTLDDGENILINGKYYCILCGIVELGKKLEKMHLEKYKPKEDKPKEDKPKEDKPKTPPVSPPTHDNPGRCELNTQRGLKCCRKCYEIPIKNGENAGKYACKQHHPEIRCELCKKSGLLRNDLQNRVLCTKCYREEKRKKKSRPPCELCKAPGLSRMSLQNRVLCKECFSNEWKKQNSKYTSPPKTKPPKQNNFYPNFESFWKEFNSTSQKSQVDKDLETLELKGLSFINASIIGSAFRKLAKRYHPDKNIGNNPNIKAKYQELQNAYDRLRVIYTI